MVNIFQTKMHANENNKNVKLETINSPKIHKNLRCKKIRAYLKYITNTISKYKKNRNNNDFNTVLFITMNNIPYEYISTYRKQYPNTLFKVLVPINKLDDYEKINSDYKFFFQNKLHTAILYKKKNKIDNIDEFGLYSETFSNKNFNKFEILAAFVKAVRIISKDINPNIIHADNIPFFLGTELESSKFKYPVKVLQIVDDFKFFEDHKQEMFWVAINLGDKNIIKKICNDEVSKKCIFKLFQLHNQKKNVSINECLDFIYENYYDFRKFVDKCEDIEENILFSRLNTRVKRLFPIINNRNDSYYNMITNSIKNADYWAVPSKTYYQSLLKNKNFTENIYRILFNTRDRSSYIKYGFTDKKADIYKDFNTENFRDFRKRNKKYILRELSKERISINFIDPKLFKNAQYKIKGYLDATKEAPIIFCKFDNDNFSKGADIALITILKLFEEYKNIQVIIAMNNALEYPQMQKLCELLEQGNRFEGQWILIDGEINSAQFYASADMSFFTSRENILTTEHYQAMEYGCVPIASRIGIFNDTISDIFDDMTYGCGFKTKAILQEDENIFDSYLHIVNKALKLYSNNPASWNLLIKNCLNYDSSWSFQIIEQYNRIYDLLK